MNFTAESMPSVMDIKKNNMAQMFDPGRVATASGYTWNTRPGPETNDDIVRNANVPTCRQLSGRAADERRRYSPSVATELMGLCCLCDMKPK